MLVAVVAGAHINLLVLILRVKILVAVARGDNEGLFDIDEPIHLVKYFERIATDFMSNLINNNRKKYVDFGLKFLNSNNIRQQLEKVNATQSMNSALSLNV